MKKLFTLAFLCMFALNTFAQELGEFNTSFGTDGSFVFDPSSAHDFMEKILVQEDGKIITVGRARVDKKNYSIYVSRHNADGTLDETYGEGGIAYLKVNPLIYMNCAFDADFDEDGYLYIAGYTFDNVNNTAFVICLDENGFENVEYGDNGYAVTEYGGGVVYEAIDVDSKGRAVVAGYINDQILVTRYNAKGNLDKTFGEEGTVVYTFGEKTNSNAFDVEVLDNGRILVAGFVIEDTGEGYYIFNSCVLRLKSNGDLDNTFGDGGTLLLYAGEYAEYAQSISVQPNGKYLIAGYDELWSDVPEMPRYESYVTRVNTNGTIDETFGDNGFVKIEPFEGDGCVNYCRSILSAADGQIFGSLYSYNFSNSASRAYVFNLDVDGKFKEDFAGSGVMALPKYADDESEIRAQTVALKDNKNLLVGGFVAVDDADNLKLFISDINVDVKELMADANAIDEKTVCVNVVPTASVTEYHVGIYTKEAYNQTANELVEALKTDAKPYTGSQEITFGDLTPKTEYVVVVVYKNSANVWNVNESYVNTPSGEGVEEILADFNIYPNPATSTIFIESTLIEKAQVSIVDLTGRCVKEVEISNAVSTINIDDVERGVYFISVEQNGNRKVEKLVVK